MPLEIRAPQVTDAEAMGRMHYASWRESYAALLPPEFWSDEAEARWVERWEANIADPSEGSTSRIAVEGTRVLGIATSGPGRANDTAGPPVRDRELWAMYVRSSEYGTGLADRLLTAVLPDDVPAELWVFEANLRARGFYAKHGFIPDGGRHVFGSEFGNQPEIRMVR